MNYVIIANLVDGIVIINHTHDSLLRFDDMPSVDTMSIDTLPVDTLHATYLREPMPDVTSRELTSQTQQPNHSKSKNTGNFFKMWEIIRDYPSHQ